MLVRKGPTVDASRTLVRDLGLVDHVTWVSEVPRNLLREYYAGSTACLGQFGTPVLANSTLEPLAWGTPTVSFFGETMTGPVPFYETLPSVQNTRDPDEIAEFLRSTLDSAHRDRIGREGWEWIVQNCSESKFIGQFEERINVRVR